ncbi:MAG: carboxypeptidase-like regulatory domain-containing protein [Alistipes sp.]|nr:carboxypeptidase-like regulatory domain-containing protein [Alistipes sp.]
MKQFVSTLFLLLSLAVAEAQTLVQGGIIDTQSKPVAYATVAILRDAKPVTATASDQQGKFHLTIKEAGDYTLSITSVGYNSYTAPLQAKGQPIQLEPITLAEGVEVDAVVLTVQKPIVTADAEKLNYSVEDDPEAQSSTLEEIIR